MYGPPAARNTTTQDFKAGLQSPYYSDPFGAFCCVRKIQGTLKQVQLLDSSAQLNRSGVTPVQYQVTNRDGSRSVTLYSNFDPKMNAADFTIPSNCVT